MQHILLDKNRQKLHIGQRLQHAGLLQDGQHNKEENKPKSATTDHPADPPLILLLIKLHLDVAPAPQLNLHPSAQAILKGHPQPRGHKADPSIYTGTNLFRVDLIE